MDEIPIGVLFATLFILILLSAFFSGSETAMMALNRYRLKHLYDQGHKGAIRASTLLEKPDRLIGLILLGNNFVNILASSIATVIALRLFGEVGIAIAAMLLTLVILIFAEVTPKTLAALKPELIAFPVSFILKPLLVILYPFVWLVNLFANGVLKLLGISPDDDNTEMIALSREELRTVVKEAGAMIPKRHQQMLFGILDLEKVTVEDIMIPRNEVFGINLDTDPSQLEEQLRSCRHTRIPVYHGTLDNVTGIMHVRKIPLLLESEEITSETIMAQCVEPYYVPIGTPLHTQLSNFQREKRRLGLVVDEYGDIQGLVTLEDILEEIVGEFTTDPGYNKDIHEQEDGSYLINASANIRDINRTLNWDLDTSGPKTLNGLIIETLETIPETGTSLKIGHYAIEILQTSHQAIKTVKVRQLTDQREQQIKELNETGYNEKRSEI